MNKPFLLFFVTCSNKKEALRIGNVLLKSRLSACVNIIPGVQSYFWWKGKIEKASEVLLMVKTKASLVSKVMDKITKLHSYECPVIEVIKIVRMNEKARKWLEETL
jgi:periplasmic divalent cation tolerance protein